MLINPKAVIRILVEKVNSLDFIASSTPDDEIFADIIFNLIIKQSFGQCEFFEEDILYNDDWDNDDDFSDDEESDHEHSEEGSSTSNYEESPVKKKSKSLHEQFPDMQTVENIVAYNTKYGAKQTFKKYKGLRNDHSRLSKLIAYYENQGTRYSKLSQIKAIVYQRFQEKREKLASVHDVDLNNWVLAAAEIVGLKDFKVGKTFITTFKKTFRISSRRIAKFVTKKTMDDDSQIQQKAQKFVSEIHVYKSQHDSSHDRVWNTDQSGFNYDMVSARTLSHQGEKDTHSLIRSMNAMTHSYTLQVLISNAGKLAPKFLLCLQEQNEIFRPVVREQIEASKPANCVINCSKSGKMSNPTFEEWIRECLNSLITDKSLLLQDSWGVQKDESLFSECLTNSTLLQIRTIQPKATKCIQSLDGYFFRQYKILARKIADGLHIFSKGQENLHNRLVITVKSE